MWIAQHYCAALKQSSTETFTNVAQKQSRHFNAPVGVKGKREREKESERESMYMQEITLLLI